MKRWYAFAAVAALIAAGCASTPEADRSLAQAKQAYAAAQANPHVPRFAAPELAQAASMIARIEAAAPNADSGWVQHHAYLAEQQARIAEQRAMARAAEAELARAAEARERLARESREAQASRSAKVLALDSELRTLRERLAKHEAQAELRAEMARLDARETAQGWVLTMASDELFDVNRTTLRPSARRHLDELARVLKQHPHQAVVIEGFTDGPGSAEINQRISEMRAASLRDALVAEGIAPSRIATRGAAGAEPRVRISILQPGASASAGR